MYSTDLHILILTDYFRFPNEFLFPFLKGVSIVKLLTVGPFQNHDYFFRINYY